MTAPQALLDAISKLEVRAPFDFIAPPQIKPVADMDGYVQIIWVHTVPDRDTRELRTIYHVETIIEDAVSTPEDAVRWLMHSLQTSLMHEFFEQILYDGKRPRDPHRHDGTIGERV